jgi:hypothetical protein
MSGQLAALMAGLAADNNMNLQALSERQPRLCTRLAKFGFGQVAQLVAGLLTAPENQPATLRIEALIHLAALHCRGSMAPTLQQLREWLNDILLKDPLGRDEDPVEDVFMSVTPSWSGNARVFEGAWQDSAAHLKVLMEGLMRLRPAPWVRPVLTEVMALLALSEAVAERSGVPRYAMSDGQPRAAVRVTARIVESGQAAVCFKIGDVLRMGITALDLSSFIFDPAEAPALADETLGHTILERKPLLPIGTTLVVVLPTAISAAARRHILERARAAGALEDLEAALQEAQLQEFMMVGPIGLQLRALGDRRELAAGITAVASEFDVGGHALIVMVSDSLVETLETGLQETQSLFGTLDTAIEPLEAEIAAREGYRRGLTVIVRGGLGRGLSAGFQEAPAGWHRVVLQLGDAVRMSWDHDFTAIRVWKILDQQDALPGRGFEVLNVNGFMNLYGYLDSQNFSPIRKDQAAPGLMTLSPDFVALERQRVRQALDDHIALAPDSRRWIEVQRPATSAFFSEARNLPLFVAPLELRHSGQMLACVETSHRPWWVVAEMHEAAEDLVHRVWDAARNWMVRLAPHLEADLEDLPDGPFSVELVFPEIGSWTEAYALESVPPARPAWSIEDGVVRISSPNAVLRGYALPTNTAERWLVAAIALGAAARAAAERDEAWADDLATRIVKSDDARFAHIIPTSNFTQQIQAAIRLPKARLLSDEDLAWARLGLAKDAGRETSGVVPGAEVGELLQTAVLHLWERIRARLEGLDRRSVVLKAVLNHEAIDKDRAEWGHTAAALLSIYDDQADVVEAHNELETRRSIAATSSRALAEMAICTCPLTGAAPCGDIDLDLLIADLAAMLECAGQCDAYYYGLATKPLQIAPNGSFDVDPGFLDQLHRPYLHAHGERAFRDAADDYAEPFGTPPVGPGVAVSAPTIAPKFEAAVRDEFGMGLEDLVHLSAKFAEDALTANRADLSLRRSALLDRFASGEHTEGVDAERAYRSLVLRPRQQWNEPKPEGALARDWQPWRMNRKLSLTRRPLVQLDDSEDPEILVFPSHLDRTIRRLLQLADGHLPAEMFDTPAARQWIGRIVDERGHAFNTTVKVKLQELGFTSESDVLMSRLGADKALGDIDVLAWSTATGDVWAIECKRLFLDRTVGEIGERLADYTTPGRRNNKRTPIQKHLDRLAYLNANPTLVANFVGIDAGRLNLKSALVTDGIVPMQFTDHMTNLVSLVCDYRGLAVAFNQQTQS